MYLYLTLAFLLTALSSCNEDKLFEDAKVIAQDVEIFADNIDEN